MITKNTKEIAIVKQLMNRHFVSSCSLIAFALISVTCPSVCHTIHSYNFNNHCTCIPWNGICIYTHTLALAWCPNPNSICVMILKMKLKNLLPVFSFYLVGFHVVSPQRCGETGNFIPHDKYDTNRHTLISSLASNASARGGFYNASLGQGSDKVYAVGLCIPGVEPTVCSTCLERGYNRLTEVCLNQTEGLVWEARGILCLIRYSNRFFFGLLELKPSYEVHNSADIRYEFPKFDSLWKNLTSRMIARATSSSSELKYYAAEAVPWTTLQNIYALMQCNPLISLGECNICLRQCVSDYVSCCHGKQGGIVYRPSCAFRSEIYPFFQAFNLTLAQPPTSLSPSAGQRTNTTKRGKLSYVFPWFKHIKTFDGFCFFVSGGESISVGIIVAIIIPTVVIFFVLLALAFFVCRRMKLKAFNRQGELFGVLFILSFIIWESDLDLFLDVFAFNFE